jgi:hypothetical protein
MMRTARLTRRGFLRLAVALPLVVLAVAAVLRGAAGEATASIVRAMVAYAGVAVWGWRISSRLPPADALTRLWYGPLLYVTLSLAVLGVMAVTHEQGVATLSAQWRLLLLRSVVQLGVGYAYLGLIRWGFAAFAAPGDVTDEGGLAS